MYRRNLFISNFKKNIVFFVKNLLLLCIVLLFCVKIVMPQYTGIFNASLIDKVKRLEAIDGPKIVLIGNSNLAFGMDSQKLELAFGMPVVNMGLHGGLGNAFHERMSMLNICEGDIYILCHTGFSDDGTIFDKTLAWTTIENHINLWRLMDLGDIYPMMKEYPIYLKKCLELFVSRKGNELPGGIYSRDVFNKYGDVVIERTSQYTFTSPVNPPSINDITIDRINKLNEKITEKGAVLLVAGYPIGKGELTAPEEEFVKIQKILSERLACPVISDYRDYMFDYSLFFDTDLHLTTEGVTLRTQQLIEDLQRWKEK